MIQFETRLKKLKHEVLKNVALLAMKDDLTKESLEKVPYEIITGEKAQYRCCVYKERAIVQERVKLAAGYMPDGDNISDEYTDIRPEEQIIYVIDAACDRCPIDKFNVTEGCRGCLAHRCIEVCPAQAISKVGGRAYINQELCKECGLCKKACPYNAISERCRPCKVACPTGALKVSLEDRKAQIEEKDCVNCGSCMANCPFGAISDKSLIVPVVKRLTHKRKMYAIVAPALSGQFGPKVSYGQIKAAFKKVGFADMFEAACGADAVTVHEAEEFVERMERGDKYMTNSCCPGFLSFIEKKFPDQVERVSGTVSPMIATGRYIKSLDPEAKVVFVGPCTAKKAEASKSNLKDAVDYVLTFEEIVAVLDAHGVNPADCEAEEIDDASVFGRGFGAGGGLTAAIENFVAGKGLEIEFKAVKASGAQELKKTMTMAKAGRLEGNFIEGMMCEGGCINGAAVVNPIYKSKGAFTKNNSQATRKAVLDNERLDAFKSIKLDRE
ncbi:4Fe-4S dicluster domain-containing protein [Alloiococcus sp. CFN-8]|uniref:4Fe-4S dicluster domain-containing protein n=1 Tax=Alloiococcus sp. CFN-8 TaxID=3416081 RepID=UPI003CFAC49D